MSLVEDILLAKRVSLGYTASFPSEFLFSVGLNIWIWERADWSRRISGVWRLVLYLRLSLLN